MSNRSFDDQWAWRLDKEPTWSPRRPHIPLSIHGALKQHFAAALPPSREAAPSGSSCWERWYAEDQAVSK